MWKTFRDANKICRKSSKVRDGRNVSIFESVLQNQIYADKVTFNLFRLQKF